MYYPAVKGALYIIEKALMEGSPEAMIGLTKPAYDKITGNSPWIGSERAVVRGYLETLCHGTTDALGLPRITIPAEYVAAVIATFVAPVNIAVACSWFEGRHAVSNDLIAYGEDPPQGMESATAARLFAMVMSVLSDDDASPLVRGFQKKMDKQLKELRNA